MILDDVLDIAQAPAPGIPLDGQRETADTISQLVMFKQGLKDRGARPCCIRFSRELHGFREPQHQRIRGTEDLAWLMQQARGIDSQTPERHDPDDSATNTTSEQKHL